MVSRARRLAALDLHGLHGTRRRRLIVFWEFVLGLVAATAIGCWVLASGILQSSVGGILVGLGLLGIAANYLPLAAYAIVLRRPAALQAELADVDVPGELRRYGVLQFLLFIPATFAILSLMDLRRDRRSHGP